MKRLALTSALLGLLVSAGCATPLAFGPSPVLPAIDPQARVRSDDNRNSLIEIEIEHMAPPSRLSPPRSVYVVWVEGEEGRILPLGQLRVGDDREGSFRGVTALDRFRILISAEHDPQATHPSQPYMLVSEFVTQDGDESR
jgi:hypothetical protein